MPKIRKYLATAAGTLKILSERKTGGTPPFFPLLYLDVTYRCNLKCRLCDIWKLPCRDEMSFDEICNVIDQAADMGTMLVSISGGEPLLRDEIYDIISHVVGRGMSCHIDTNGVLIDREMAERLNAAGLCCAYVSLDGHKADIHNYLRGSDGAFDATIEGIANLRKYAKNISVGVNTVINRLNCENLVDIALLAKNNDVDVIKYIPANVLFPYNQKSNQDSELILRTEDSRRLKKSIENIKIFMKKNGMYTTSHEYLDGTVDYAVKMKTAVKCLSGYLWLNVDPYGDVRACTPLAEPIGNIRRNKMKETWHSELMNDVRKRVVKGN